MIQGMEFRSFLYFTTTHLLNELEYHFSVIGITETKIANSDLPEQLPSLPGYEFEFVPLPLSSGGVGMFICDKFNYKIIEKISSNAFQALGRVSFGKEKQYDLWNNLQAT